MVGSKQPGCIWLRQAVQDDSVGSIKVQRDESIYGGAFAAVRRDAVDMLLLHALTSPVCSVAAAGKPKPARVGLGWG